MGLLDSMEDPKTQALLAMGFGLLNSRGNFGQGLGQAGQQAMGAYGDARKQQQQQKRLDQESALQQAQIANIAQQETLRKQQALKEVQKQAFLAQLMGGGAPQGGQSPERPQGGQPAMPQGGGMPQGGSMLSRMNEDQIIAAIGSGSLPEKAYDAWKFAKVGEQMQPGYQRMPDGTMRYNADPTKGITLGPNGSVQQMPGAAAALSGLAGANAGATTAAQEAAKAPYTPIQGYDPVRQAPIVTSVADWMKGNQPPVPRTDMRLDAVDPSTQYSSPAVKAAVQRAAGVPSGAMQTGPSQSARATAETTSDVNKDWLSTSYKPVVESGNAAKNVLTSISVARRGLALAGNSGWGTEAQVAGARVLGALGVDKADQMASGAQIFQQAASTRLWDVLNNAKGVQTKDDASRAEATFAKLGNTGKANNFILDLAQATAERDSRKAAWYRDAIPIGQQAGDLQMLDRKWQEREPSIWQMPSMQKWGK